MKNNLDVLIVCGQGTYIDGRYYTEYHDRDVYLTHAINVRNIVSIFNYSHIVCSGGFTQKATPHLSEARSFENIWTDTNTYPNIDGGNIFFDECSLDSAENVYLGLMELRKQVGSGPKIRRIGVFTAWKFKKSRFTYLAQELGIIERFYFHGQAHADESSVGDLASKGEYKQLKRIIDTGDYLLLTKEWEQKRRERYHGTNFNMRLEHLREYFNKSFTVLDEIRTYGVNDDRRKKLQEALRLEVIEP